MSKARQSKKRVVLRRAAKRRTRYDGSGVHFAGLEPPVRMPWKAESESGLRFDGSSEEADRIEVQV